ncbi:MAG: hypothetical protein R3F59_31150 [Myxococcota bacterium]
MGGVALAGGVGAAVTATGLLSGADARIAAHPLAGAGVLVAVLLVSVASPILRAGSARERALGVAVVGTALTAVTTAAAPGASYLFAWPTAGALLAASPVGERPWAAAVAGAPAAVLFAPLGWHLFVALPAGSVPGPRRGGGRHRGRVGGASAPARSLRGAGLAVAAAALRCLACAARERPGGSDHVGYVWDADAHQGLLISADPTPPAWPGPRLVRRDPRTARGGADPHPPLLAGPLRGSPAPAPTLTASRDGADWVVDVVPADPSDTVFVYVEGAEAARWEGLRIEAAPNSPVAVRFVGLPAIRLHVASPREGAVLTALETHPGLPFARPAGAPSRLQFADTTSAGASIELVPEVATRPAREESP